MSDMGSLGLSRCCLSACNAVYRETRGTHGGGRQSRPMREFTNPLDPASGKSVLSWPRLKLMMRSKEGRLTGEKSLGRQQGEGAGAQEWGFISATSTVSFTSVKRGDASMQRDAAGLVDRMLVTCGTFLLVASFIVKRKEGHQLSVRATKSC